MPYEPMTLARLGAMLAGSDDSRRWRLVAEFLEEYGWEPAERRGALLDQEPERTGDEQWDVFLAALAEHLAAKDGLARQNGLRPERCDDSGSRSTPGPRASTLS